MAHAPHTPFGLGGIARVTDARTRSISAENPTGAKSGGAQASPGDDAHCTAASRELGRGWKVRPCLRAIAPRATVTLAAIDGPGTIQHLWCTVLPPLASQITLRVFYDDDATPAVAVPLADFFVNGIDGLARVRSIPVAVNPRGGMNSYWPMPFHGHVRIDITNDSDAPIPEFFYQVTYALHAHDDATGRLHAEARTTVTTVDHPEHAIVEGITARGHYVGTVLRWHQTAPGWWGEGEVKHFIDGDPPDGPTLCGTGTEDYFGGAWSFHDDDPGSERPVCYSGPFLGYPQVAFERPDTLHPAVHALYRWHLPDPVHFERDLRVTVQALGWNGDVYRPLTDRIASVALWYQLHG